METKHLAIRVPTKKSAKHLIIAGISNRELENLLLHPNITYILDEKEIPSFGIYGVLKDNMISDDDYRELRFGNFHILPRLITDKHGKSIESYDIRDILNRYIKRLNGENTLILHLTEVEYLEFKSIVTMYHHLDI